MLKNTKIAFLVSEKLGKLFAKLPVEPNSITLLSVVLAILGFVSYAPNPASGLETLLLFIFAFAFDAIDGAIARAKNKVTKDGAFLDGITDRIVEFFLILTLFNALAFNLEVSNLLIVILFFGVGMTSFVKAYAEHRGVLDHETATNLPGLLERTERAILLLLVFIAMMFSTLDHVRILLYITAAFSVITFLQRFYLVLYSKEQKK